MAKPASRVLRTGGLYFNGGDNYVQLPYLNIFDVGDFSIVLRANLVSLNRENWFFSIGDAKATDRYIHVGVRPNNYLAFGFYSDDLNDIMLMEANKQYHIVATFKRDTRLREVFVNGVGRKSGRSTGVPVIKTGEATGGGMWLGRLIDYYANCLIDDVMLYSRVLSGAEISEIYNKGTVIRDGLVLCLPFHEGEGNIVHDVSGYNNHGTIYGGTAWVVKKALVR